MILIHLERDCIVNVGHVIVHNSQRHILSAENSCLVLPKAEAQIAITVIHIGDPNLFDMLNSSVRVDRIPG